MFWNLKYKSHVKKFSLAVTCMRLYCFPFLVKVLSIFLTWKTKNSLIWQMTLPDISFSSETFVISSLLFRFSTTTEKDWKCLMGLTPSATLSFQQPYKDDVTRIQYRTEVKSFTNTIYSAKKKKKRKKCCCQRTMKYRQSPNERLTIASADSRYLHCVSWTVFVS